MFIINSIEINQVSGGFTHYVAPMVAIGAGIGIYNGGADLLNSTNTYGVLGQSIGAKAFDFIHPDVTGQMIYTIEDFEFNNE